MLDQVIQWGRRDINMQILDGKICLKIYLMNLQFHQRTLSWIFNIFCLVVFSCDKHLFISYNEDFKDICERISTGFRRNYIILMLVCIILF